MALTLGRLRGSALVGKPLDVQVQAQLGEGDDAAAPCFSAEVFHADTRQEASRVRVLAGPVGPDQTLSLRVLSSAVVDEPVVAVNLHVGCAQNISRRYVLLAEAPIEVAAPAAPLIEPLLVTAPSSAAPRPAEPAPALKPKAVQARKLSEPVAAKPRRIKPVEPAKPPRPSGQARLKLDTLELTSDRVVPTAPVAPVATVAPTEDVLRNTERLQALEEAVKASLAQTAKSEASLADMKLRLAKAESERVPEGWLYALIAVALAGLGGVAYLLMRLRALKQDSGDWMTVKGAAAAPVAPSFAAVREDSPALVGASAELDFTLPAATSGGAASGTPSNLAPVDEMDVDHIEMSDSKFASFMTTEEMTHERLDAPEPLLPNVPALPRALVLELHDEAALDIRQQAEFFVSLGQTDRAIRILKKKIDAGTEANPFIYLDLLGIYHSLNQKQEFQDLRLGFNSIFTGIVPEFAQFKNEGHGLEFYEDEFKNIVDRWPTTPVLALMESYILRNPSHPQSRSFELAAFRDLLLLHAIAESVAVSPESILVQDKGPAVASVELDTHKSYDFLSMDFDAGTQFTSSHQTSNAPLDLDLDLDLSESMSNDAAKSSAVSDIDFPHLTLAKQAHVEADNLIQFDLPMPPSKG
jgi:pilus assembly protein FimV